MLLIHNPVLHASVKLNFLHCYIMLWKLTTSKTTEERQYSMLVNCFNILSINFSSNQHNSLEGYIPKSVYLNYGLDSGHEDDESGWNRWLALIIVGMWAMGPHMMAPKEPQSSLISVNQINMSTTPQWFPPNCASKLGEDDHPIVGKFYLKPHFISLFDVCLPLIMGRIGWVIFWTKSGMYLGGIEFSHKDPDFLRF